MMPEHGKPDSRVVPMQPPTKGDSELPPGSARAKPAETVAGRRLAKSNPHQQTMLRTQRRVRLPHELERIRQAANRDRKRRFTTLFHHVDRLDPLRRAAFGLNPKAAPGVDGVTWQPYGEAWEANLQDLAGGLKRGAYRAKPTRRSYMAKADGRPRPLGLTALEDKIVQAALVEVLNAVYEVDCLGFSYGSRPGRSPYDALDALSVAIERSKVNGVLSVNIWGYFDCAS
jgi:RNA-directed DNA polymerase